MPDVDNTDSDRDAACQICHKAHPADADCQPIALKVPPKQSDGLVGTALGNYDVETVLGRGGMSVVYKAKHRVAIPSPILF